MITETDLRETLRARAATARVFDADNVLRHARLAATETTGARATSRRGRQWVLTGAAAACVVAVAATPAVLLGQGSAHRPQPASMGAGAGVTNTPSTGSQPTQITPSNRLSTPATRASGKSAGHSQTPLPAASDWIDSRNDPGMVIDPAAIVFSNDPILSYYQRAYQQLSILPAGETAKDSSDAQWHTAVQVYLPGSNFNAVPVEAAPTMTVNGISRHITDQPRILNVPGPSRVSSLAWQVGQAWVILQIDTPAEPTNAQLAAAAQLIDVHPGG